MGTNRPEDPKAENANGEADSRIGVDEWVLQFDQRRRRRSGLWGEILERWETIPYYVRMSALLVLLILGPILTDFDPVVIRPGATFLAFSILAIGLTVVVGYAGLLDLGYNAFFGIAGYTYAYLSSDFIGEGVHVNSLLAIPLIIGFTAAVGWLLGSASLRLKGDYLAIVTLGFGLLMVRLALTLTRVQLPWLERPVDLTRGPNGINLLDDVSVFGYTFESTEQYYYLFLALLVLVFFLVERLRNSRLGRAWRAMREDELAAEIMGIPTRRLKLMAFAIGAGIAAIPGTVFAAWQGNVVPNRYDVAPLLINLYAMIVLGGLGSLPGALVGAFIFTALPEVLRNVVWAGALFYGGGLLALVLWIRPWRRLILTIGGAVLGGWVLNLAVNTFAPSLDSGVPPGQGSFFNEIIQGWLVIPESFSLLGNIAIGAGLALLMATLYLREPWRSILLAVAIYVFAFAWETRLATEASVTRIIIVGVSLVVLMIRRPQGLFGKLRVTII